MLSLVFGQLRPRSQQIGILLSHVLCMRGLVDESYQGEPTELELYDLPEAVSLPRPAKLSYVFLPREIPATPVPVISTVHRK